ncbi:MscL family protein [Cellulomonas sp. URHD0024]|uniref:large conductance mechanosensitive channel protein MscL n=1 Tax=Cellulomonas sp. URHD0024 TaxID=1302620 RepID=UPI0004105CF9|nr:MscL family protein [Cellulomonas sp. URHD0024]
MTDRFTSGDGLHGSRPVLQGFKDFIARGNAIELAVGVVIGIAFGAVINAVQDNFLNPLIGWIFGQPNLDNLWNIGPYTWPGNDGAQPIQVGVILNALMAFLLTAVAVYFFVILPLNALANRRRRGVEAEPAAPAEDILLLQEIRDLLAGRAAPGGRNDPGPNTPGTPPPPT